jgi:toxin ParE1/3/4
MRRVRWSAEADASLVQLIRFLRSRNREDAIRAAVELKALSRRLGPLPELGRAGRLPGTRELSAPDWKQVLVYRLDDAGIEIIALRDTRMIPED